MSSRADLEYCWRIRWDVFVEEQRVPGEEEIDELDTDPTTTHVLAVVTSDDGTEDPVATARLLPGGSGVVRIGRVAVLARARGTGAGRAVMRALHEVAAVEHGEAGTVRVDIEAQEHAIGFYEGLGYVLVSDRRYLDAGIWHKDMALTLPA